MTNPSTLKTISGVTLYEHPEFGDEFPCLVKVGGNFYDTSFYDPDEGDMEYVVEMIQEIKAGEGGHEPINFNQA